MARGETWREALENASADTEKKGSKRKRNGLVPGLHTPAGMLALLTIAHPHDEKFKDWIVQRLQIDWMLTQERTQLEVSDGFWKGVTATNVYQIFAKEEDRQPKVEVLANYTRLFGPDFPVAQKDMRPYLREWAPNLAISNGGSDNSFDKASDARSDLSEHDSDKLSDCPSPSISSKDGDQQPDIPKFSEQDISALHKGLFPTTSMPSAELQYWLADRLSVGKEDPLLYWCQHWEKRLRATAHYQDQLLVQSLFLQSLQRLCHLNTLSLPSLDAIAAMRSVANEEAALHTPLWTITTCFLMWRTAHRGRRCKKPWLTSSGTTCDAFPQDVPWAMQSPSLRRLPPRRQCGSICI